MKEKVVRVSARNFYLRPSLLNRTPKMSTYMYVLPHIQYLHISSLAISSCQRSGLSLVASPHEDGGHSPPDLPLFMVGIRCCVLNSFVVLRPLK